MAVGDLFWFDHAVALGFPNSSALSSGDVILLGANTTAGVTSTSTGLWSSYTEASTGAGSTDNYPSSGSSLGEWGAMWSTVAAAGTWTFDSTANPTWTQDNSHSTSMTFAIGYVQTDSRTLFAVDLGDVDGTAGDLTITFNASGIATVANT
jgi:hypothetical protein